MIFIIKVEYLPSLSLSALLFVFWSTNSCLNLNCFQRSVSLLLSNCHPLFHEVILKWLDQIFIDNKLQQNCPFWMNQVSVYTCELRLRRLGTTHYTEARASPPLETLRKMDVKIHRFWNINCQLYSMPSKGERYNDWKMNITFSLFFDLCNMCLLCIPYTAVVRALVKQRNWKK